MTDYPSELSTKPAAAAGTPHGETAMSAPKVVLIAVIAFATLIPNVFVAGLIAERETRQQQVQSECLSIAPRCRPKSDDRRLGAAHPFQCRRSCEPRHRIVVRLMANLLQLDELLGTAYDLRGEGHTPSLPARILRKAMVQRAIGVRPGFIWPTFSRPNQQVRAAPSEYMKQGVVRSADGALEIRLSRLGRTGTGQLARRADQPRALRTGFSTF